MEIVEKKAKPQIQVQKMKALKEIGIRKAIKFAFLTILTIIYKIMVFPQLRVFYMRVLGAKIGKNVIIHLTFRTKPRAEN